MSRSTTDREYKEAIKEQIEYKDGTWEPYRCHFPRSCYE